jgi:pSer/pThr/pTyr-binding forkhead associated (FHA) protein
MINSKSNNKKTESIREKEIGFLKEVSRDILDEIKKMPLEKSGLVVIKGPNIGDKFFINKSKLTVGRNPKSDVFLDDITVSRKHAVLKKTGQDFKLIDSGSLNGSYLNGKIVDESLLKSGDKIQIGKYIFLFFHHGKK